MGSCPFTQEIIVKFRKLWLFCQFTNQQKYVIIYIENK
jgi:hypothetical protein